MKQVLEKCEYFPNKDNSSEAKSLEKRTSQLVGNNSLGVALCVNSSELMQTSLRTYGAVHRLNINSILLTDFVERIVGKDQKVRYQGMDIRVDMR
jgi:hypothetical protein